MEKIITVKLGYSLNGNFITVIEESFESFELANDWSSVTMFEFGYDTCEFYHIDGEDVMQEIINEYLDQL